MQKLGKLFSPILAVLFLIAPTSGWSHVKIDRADPREGTTIETSPSSIRLWFDDAIENQLSKISVKDSNGAVVEKGKAQVNKTDSKLLEVELEPLSTGKYDVKWNVVSRDGHRTQGDYSFNVR